MPITKHRTNRKNKDRSLKYKPDIKIEGLMNLIGRFPDTSRDSVVADARSYRERAHIRVERANIRRTNRKLKRLKNAN